MPEDAPTSGFQVAGLDGRLPQRLGDALDAALSDWRDQDGVRRLWDGDASLWTNADEARWLEWLRIVPKQLDELDRLQSLVDSVAADGFEHALVLGMGGSSLCPEVLSLTWDRVAGHPELLILDSTDPAQVRRVKGSIRPERTLFIVSSKSGSTLEPSIFMQYFRHEVEGCVGPERAGDHFVAVTDPGSQLEAVARREGFRAICAGVPGIGGRYSALSDFGLVPAALMGLDVRRLLERAATMMDACADDVPVERNPGLVLGLVLGLAAKAGRDKLTLLTSPGLRDAGAWLEQLVAESTGKQGLGLIPSDREELGPPEVYGGDRVFVHLGLEEEPDSARDVALARLAEAGHPVVRIQARDRYDLGQEFFRWEFATAVAGAVLGIHPFDQPDVEASKVATRSLTEEHERSGTLPDEAAFASDATFRLFADPRQADALRETASEPAGVREILRAHLARLGAGDYFAVLAYVDMNETHQRILQALRQAVRDGRRVATCVGFGPRFLHSTGQAYKGGPASGVFLLITCDDAEDLTVPGRRYSFGVVKAAQARGDFEVLASRERRALRVHLGKDVTRGLEALRALVVEEVGTCSLE